MLAQGPAAGGLPLPAAAAAAATAPAVGGGLVGGMEGGRVGGKEGKAAFEVYKRFMESVPGDLVQVDVL